jgi:hypothetical protein
MVKSLPVRPDFVKVARKRRQVRRLTFDMSGPELAWPAQRNIDKKSEAGQAGGGPLDGRVRHRLGDGRCDGDFVLILRLRGGHGAKVSSAGAGTTD